MEWKYNKGTDETGIREDRWLKPDTSTLSNQLGQEWRFPFGGKVAMCFKSFLHVCDKACQHQHYLLIPVWPATRTFQSVTRQQADTWS